ncbi:hypothetical protein [Amycolatopsis benzoatilytica]|uniref:hypothetical protein n=1 Tax=Amycolatopsis benzoatilytica TaxID=346045 RepID=UPI000376A341|nr:hypothetical protein [Amycolatopsis benzoatilytica]
MLITNNDLPALTVAALNRAYEDLALRLADYDGVHGDRLSARLVAIVDELHTRAGRENIARSMITDDLQDMLPDFEEVAAVCGIRPARARMNRQLVVDELRRRGVDA